VSARRWIGWGFLVAQAAQEVKAEVDRALRPLVGVVVVRRLGRGGRDCCDLNRDVVPRLEQRDDVALGTSPSNEDADDDRLDDRAAVIRYKTNLLRPDTDRDRLGDRVEIKIYKTNPLKADTDRDGYSDRAEIKAGSNPKNNKSKPHKPKVKPKRVEDHPGRGDGTGVPMSFCPREWLGVNPAPKRKGWVA
jgi:hypothetical protein